MTPQPSHKELVIFFPPGCARDTDATCVLITNGNEVARLTLAKSAETLVVAGQARATGVRGPDRPVVVRIACREAVTSCRIGLRAPVATPALGAALTFDTIEASPGIVAEFIATVSDASLPRGLATGTAQAGAVDHVSIAGGITGWIADLTRAEPHMVELRCGPQLIARAIADRPRPATAPMADKAPLGRFSIPWADIDRQALARCAPDDAVIACIPALNARLDHAYRPLSARTALILAGPELTLAEPPREPLPTPTGATTTVVVLSYNYADYLPQRLNSLLSQDAEIILLDDASTDSSIQTALTLANAANRDIQIVASPVNSGAVLPQWRRAAMLARGDYLLIAEADDVADPALIPTLATMLDANPDMAFAFADSAQIDATGAITRSDHKAYYAALGDRALERERVIPADEFLLRFLLPRNLVVNVSAVLWRTAALRAAFARLHDETDYRATGDWRVYIEACRAGGTVGYVPTVLNHFRRHDGSVIARQTRATHLTEVEAIHALLLRLTGDDPTTAERLAHHRATLHRLWSMDAAHEAS